MGLESVRIVTKILVIVKVLNSAWMLYLAYRSFDHGGAREKFMAVLHMCQILAGLVVFLCCDGPKTLPHPGLFLIVFSVISLAAIVVLRFFCPNCDTDVEMNNLITFSWCCSCADFVLNVSITGNLAKMESLRGSGNNNNNNGDGEDLLSPLPIPTRLPSAPRLSAHLESNQINLESSQQVNPEPRRGVFSRIFNRTREVRGEHGGTERHRSRALRLPSVPLLSPRDLLDSHQETCGDGAKPLGIDEKENEEAWAIFEEKEEEFESKQECTVETSPPSVPVRD
ncbi:hypothetical protein PMAYCL1PPCAC_08662, partial [Pristionchus mayeri]